MLRNATIVRNIAGDEGGGIWVHPDETNNASIIRNVIAWDNSANCNDSCTQDEIDQIWLDDSYPGVTVTYSDIMNYTVTGHFDTVIHENNLGEDPSFRDADGPNDVANDDDDDFRLTHCSPVLDRADSTDFPEDIYDIDDNDDDEELLPDLDPADRAIDLDYVTNLGDGDPEFVDLGAFELEECSGVVGEPFQPFDIMMILPAQMDSIALNGDWFLVGSPVGYSPTFTGSAHFLRWDSTEWVGPDSVAASSPEVGDLFGIDLAVDGVWAVIGALGSGSTPDNSGAAYIFELNTGNNTWSQAVKLSPGTATEDAFFGRAVDVDGDVIAISALLDDEEEAEDGIVFVYRYDGESEWELEDLLLPPSGAENFGRSIAISGDLIAVGYDLEGLGLAGGVAVYKEQHGVWSSHTDALNYTSLGEPEDSGFGVSVAMTGKAIVVGACGDSGDGDGRVHVFQLRNGYFEEVAILTAPGINEDDGFGLSVDISAALSLSALPFRNRTMWVQPMFSLAIRATVPGK